MIQPIIIVGNPRSGTSLLRLMLTCHPNICIPPEGPFIIFLEPKYGHITYFDDVMIESFVDDLFNVTKIDEWNLDRNRLIQRLKDGSRNSFFCAVDAVYREYMDTIGQTKKRWGDKSGSYTIGGLDIIKRSLPNALFLHIVRDGRDVACSYRALRGMQGKYAPNLPSDPLEIAYQWKSNVNYIRQFLSELPAIQKAEIRYEDLVISPAATLRKLCSDLGEEYDPGMLDFYLQNAKLSLEPKVYLAWKQKTLEEVTNSQVERWKTELSEKDWRLFQFIARKVLVRHGYRLETSVGISLSSLLLRFHSATWLLRRRGQVLIRKMKRTIRRLLDWKEKVSETPK